VLDMPVVSVQEADVTDFVCEADEAKATRDKRTAASGPSSTGAGPRTTFKTNCCNARGCLRAPQQGFSWNGTPYDRARL